MSAVRSGTDAAQRRTAPGPGGDGDLAGRLVQEGVAHLLGTLRELGALPEAGVAADVVVQGLRCLVVVHPGADAEPPAREQDGERRAHPLLDAGPSGAAEDRSEAPVVQGEHLTPREREVAELVAQGHTNRAVASLLDISEYTVSTHLRRLFAKLGVSSRAAMVARLRESAWEHAAVPGGPQDVRLPGAVAAP